jgi:RNA polymerase sigma factor (sigma-70 family)
VRRGHHGAFEALVQRYQPRLLAFCRHMLGSQEDAEDVLQEVFAASFNAICADERPINARPWLYRIARNRCLNHLRRPQPSGQDSMDVFERDGGASTADTVHKREEFLHLVADVRGLPETQRTALLLREIDALSYDQIAETMDTTVPSVKSLLVRARVSLAEAAEARLLTCDEVRLELGQVAEGLAKTSAPARRHLRACERCRVFKGEMRKTTKALAAVYPIGPFIFLKKLSLAKLGMGGAASSAAGAGSATTGAAGIAGGAAGAAGGAAGAAGGAAGAASGITAGGAVSAGVGTIATKAAAGVAAAAIVTAGAVEVRHATIERQPVRSAPIAVAAPHVAPKPKPAPAPARVVKPLPAPAPVKAAPKPVVAARAEPVGPEAPAPAAPATPASTKTTPAPPPPAPKPPVVEEEQSTVTLPPPSEPQDQTQPPPPPPAAAPAPGAGQPYGPPPVPAPDPGSAGPTPNPPPSD